VKPNLLLVSLLEHLFPCKHYFDMGIQKNDKVKWKWGNGQAEGKVDQTYSEKVTRKIDGKEITRKGSQDNKALYIKNSGGNDVLKLESEVEKA
jgi:hypothetical protein